MSLAVSSSLYSGSAARGPALCSGRGSWEWESDPCGRQLPSHGQLLGKWVKKERICITECISSSPFLQFQQLLLVK